MTHTFTQFYAIFYSYMDDIRFMWKHYFLHLFYHACPPPIQQYACVNFDNKNELENLELPMTNGISSSKKLQ